MKELRHKARIAALQGLYQLDIQRLECDADLADALGPLLDGLELVPEAADHARSLAAGAWVRHDIYDQMIASVSDHWEISRMAVVDRNILRLALHELLERPDVPVRVVFDEAIEIGREFGEAQTPHFVNGVLDAVWKHHPACRQVRGEGQQPSAGAGDHNERPAEGGA